jgi:tetratricopeptide (TPR) repeat protein
MNHKGKVTTIAILLAVVLFAGSIATLQQVNAARGEQATLEEILYVSSGKTLKRMSLGYSNLLADIYWTRAVQYFGERHDRVYGRPQEKVAPPYDLLYPLLDITTDLDPQLIPAYQSGSIFLAVKPPAGAGQPEKAVALVEKGIRENPTYWRLYFTLGFIHYFDRRDYKAAEEAFQKGSEVPGALPWMKVMAAKMAEHAHDNSIAVQLWKGVYEMSRDKMVKQSALDHIASLQTDSALDSLERQVQAYREKTGASPSGWPDMVRAGLLPGIPIDSTGSPFTLMADGTVTVKDPSKFPFLGEGREKVR